MSLHLEEPATHDAPAHPEDSETQLAESNLIMLFGCTGTGKTSFANIASGSDMQVGKGLRSSTKYLEESKVFRVDNRPVAIVDCPGFNDTYLTETEILRRLADYLTNAYTSKYKIVGFLYFHKISDTRVGGASFLHMNLFKALCGTDALKNAVYVTNMWSDPPTEDEMLRELELRETDKFFGEALANGAQMARHDNTPESAHEIIRKVLGMKPVTTKLQRQLVDDKMPLEETDAGLVIGEDLEDDLRKQQEEMEEVKEAKEKALESNNQGWLQRLEAQEERTKAKEQQLIEQLRALKERKAKQPEIARPHGGHNQSRVIMPDLSAQFRAQMEAKMNEIMQKPSSHSKPLDTSIPTQQEWDKQKDAEIAREIGRIGTEASYSRSHAGDRGPGALDLLVGAGTAVVSVLSRISNLNRGASSSTARDRHHPRAYPSTTHGSPVENVRGTFESPNYPNPGPDLQDTRGRYEHGSSSSRRRRSEGHRSTHDDRESRATSSRTQHQGYENTRAHGRGYPSSSPGYEF